jgi:hypothetical protein
MSSNQFLLSASRKISGAESGGRNTINGKLVRNPQKGMTAAGKYQIIDKTWRGVERQAGRKLDRMSEADNDYAMGILTNNYVKALSQRGLPITDQTLYAMHLKGNASWVEKAIKNPNAPVEEAFTQEEIRANKSYLQGKTLGQALNILGNKVGSNMSSYNIPSLDNRVGNKVEEDNTEEDENDGWVFGSGKNEESAAPLPKERKKETTTPEEDIEEDYYDDIEEIDNVEEQYYEDNQEEDSMEFFAKGGEKKNKKNPPLVIKDYRVNNQMVSDNTRNQYTKNQLNLTPEQYSKLHGEKKKKNLLLVKSKPKNVTDFANHIGTAYWKYYYPLVNDMNVDVIEGNPIEQNEAFYKNKLNNKTYDEISFLSHGLVNNDMYMIGDNSRLKNKPEIDNKMEISEDEYRRTNPYTNRVLNASQLQYLQDLKMNKSGEVFVNACNASDDNCRLRAMEKEVAENSTEEERYKNKLYEYPLVYSIHKYIKGNPTVYGNTGDTYNLSYDTKIQDGKYYKSDETFNPINTITGDVDSEYILNINKNAILNNLENKKYNITYSNGGEMKKPKKIQDLKKYLK